MNKIRLIGATLAAAALFALPQPASAATWTTTYQGVVTSGFDGVGTFGLGCLACGVGNDLDGLAFTAAFVTDSSAAGATTLSGPNSLSVSGAGVVSASLTINGKTLFLGGASGDQTLSDDGTVQTASHSAGAHDESLNYVDDPELGQLLIGHIYNANLSFAVTGLGDGNFNTLPAGMIGTGSLSESEEAFAGLYGVSGDGGAQLLVTSVQMTSDAVPEPKTWALVILGFGAAGAILRRRGGRRLAESTAR
ncbi:MAG TPA: PEPxxWA-CTERM sorting domain-containing protein [Phenylobacterium sp.]|nr:PEPxxWA-CTERM sorting domain-containing protein [Phenylobacterium sp.]